MVRVIDPELDTIKVCATADRYERTAELTVENHDVLTTPLPELELPLVKIFED
jgi:hypothetical protein